MLPKYHSFHVLQIFQNFLILHNRPKCPLDFRVRLKSVKICMHSFSQSREFFNSIQTGRCTFFKIFERFLHSQTQAYMHNLLFGKYTYNFHRFIFLILQILHHFTHRFTPLNPLPEFKDIPKFQNLSAVCLPNFSQFEQFYQILKIYIQVFP